jgi:hypothetical protein
MEMIKNYLINECRQNPEVVTKILAPLEKHEDICSELANWIIERKYTQDCPLTIEGYTAQMISDLAPFMDGVGVYNFMVTLRERPDNAKRIISEGFPIK